jgi:NAD(P)-dependent dehydrogenase (short-subunit alcohol dehydrogenase family)
MCVVLADLNEARGRQIEAKITSTGGQACFVPVDVGTSDGCKHMVDTALEHFGDLYALVNNARWHPHEMLVDVTEADWDRSQDVLLKSHFLACKYSIPHMIAGGGGSIVGISSGHATQSSADEGPYEAAKAAIPGLMRNVAVGYGPDGIRANSILPGGIMTDVKHEAAASDPDPEADAWQARQNPVRRRGEAQDVANAVLFLVSDLATFVSGASLVVDGGMSIELPGSVASRL